MKRKSDLYFSVKYLLMGLTIVCLLLLVITYAKGGSIAVYKNAIADFFSPLQTAVHNIGDWFEEKEKLQEEKESLVAEIEKLQTMNEALQEQIYGYQNEAIELAELRELFALQEKHSEYEMIGARIIAKESGAWFHKFTINRGTADGVEIDMNVLAAGGLVGIVTDVGEHYAIVTSIIDDQMNVSACSLASRDSCMIMGDLECMSQGYIRIMYVQKDAEIRDYDAIITSNTSSKYLPGILIGYAIHFETDPNNLTKSGYLLPAVDFHSIETVLVITDKKQQTP